MSSRFSTRFKKRAVEKALNNSNGLTIKDVATSCGVGYSTLQRWIGDSRVPAFKQMDKTYNMASEKRPEDWSLADRLGIIIACDGLDGKGLSALCRKSGLYPHHIEQWKADFLTGNASGRKTKSSENARLRKENKALKKELNRKEKALAETAALLVLKKKVATFWDEEDEGN